MLTVVQIIGDTKVASHYINPQDIWNLFYDIYDGNEYACAGAMGNMQFESGLYSDNAENAWNKQTGHSDEWLTQGINNGTISEAEFLQHSWYVNAYGFGYGLSQWTTDSRRRKLWDYTKDQGLDIDSQVGQFNYIRWEWLDENSPYHQYLQGMKNCTTIYDATVYYNDHYEVGTWKQLRYTYAKNWYDTFAGQPQDTYYVELNIVGNGTGYVYPTRARQSDTIELNVEPATGETLIDIEARCVSSGQAVALSVQTGSQYFPMPNDDIYIIVTFSGTPPVPPPAPTKKKCPLFLFSKKRRILW